VRVYKRGHVRVCVCVCACVAEEGEKRALTCVRVRVLLGRGWDKCVCGVCVCACVRVCVCACVACVRAHHCVCACMHACMHVCMCMCMCACMHLCIYVHLCACVRGSMCVFRMLPHAEEVIPTRGAASRILRCRHGRDQIPAGRCEEAGPCVMKYSSDGESDASKPPPSLCTNWSCKPSPPPSPSRNSNKSRLENSLLTLFQICPTSPYTNTPTRTRSDVHSVG